MPDARGTPVRDSSTSTHVSQRGECLLERRFGGARCSLRVFSHASSAATFSRSPESMRSTSASCGPPMPLRPNTMYSALIASAKSASVSGKACFVCAS